MVINFETRGSNGNFEPGYVTLLLKELVTLEGSLLNLGSLT